MLKKNLKYFIALIVIAVLPLIINDKYILSLIQLTAYTTIAVIGLNVLLSLSGQMSIGQGGFYGIAAYCSAILTTQIGWSLPFAIIVALVLTTIVGAFIGLITLKSKELHLAMMTLAFGFIIEILAERWVGLTGGTMGLYDIPAISLPIPKLESISYFWIAGLLALIMQALSDYIFASGWRRNLLAIKTSEPFAQTLGLNVSAWKIGVFIFSAVTAGLAGILFAHQDGYISSTAFGIWLSAGLLIAAVVGGLGFSYGPVLGVIIATAIAEFTAGIPELSLLINGLILLGVLLLFPSGAMGALLKLNKLVRNNKLNHTSTPDIADFEPQGWFPRISEPLTITNVTKSYSGVVAVDGVSLSVQPGTIHAIIGPNGAGKSTLINVIAGLYKADTGKALLGKTNILKDGAHKRKDLGIARTFQNLQLVPSLTVLENVLLGLDQKVNLLKEIVHWAKGQLDDDIKATCRTILKYFGIDSLANQYPSDLPYGHRKLCELARAVAQKPSVLLLDEPIAGLNTTEASKLAQVIMRLKECGATIILVEHNMDFVMEVSDEITVLNYGKNIANGTPEEIKTNKDVIAAYLGDWEG